MNAREQSKVLDAAGFGSRDVTGGLNTPRPHQLHTNRSLFSSSANILEYKEQGRVGISTAEEAEGRPNFPRHADGPSRGEPVRCSDIPISQGRCPHKASLTRSILQGKPGNRSLEQIK